MVQLNGQRPRGPALLALGVLTGAVTVAIGVALLTRVDTAFGAVWAAGLVLLGLVVASAWLAGRAAAAAPPPVRRESWRGEDASFHPRRSAARMLLLTTGLLGAWTLVVAVVGAAQETWLWLVLAGIPTVYLLGFPLLWAAGRLRPGGVWVTPTRVVDEHYGTCSELAFSDVAAISPRTSELHVTPREGAAVTRRRLAPRPWRAPARGPMLVIHTADLADGSPGLVAALQPHLDTPGR